MIVSRMAELARLDALLAALVRGEGGALVVHGEAGIGKTTLLDALVERCGGAVTVVRTCGAETETEHAFSGLTELLYPVLRQLDALPAPQAAALMSALALEAPAPGDRLAVCVAALGMLRAEARRRPVLAVVDDVQWVDTSSRECIEYIARRASGPLAVVLAARDPWYPRSVFACRICPSARSTTARRPNSSGSAPRSWRRPSRRRSRRPRRATRWPWSSCPPR